MAPDLGALSSPKCEQGHLRHVTAWQGRGAAAKSHTNNLVYSMSFC